VDASACTVVRKIRPYHNPLHVRALARGPQGDRGTDEGLDEVIVDRHAELSDWAEILGKVHKRKIQIFAYANNHYAGYAPATIEMFRGLLECPEKT
jgi:uncharacterized protein YecE (DUF72 family)